MKKLLRSPFGMSVLSLVLATYLWLVRYTVRWTFRDNAAARSLFDGGGGLIVCLWHARLAATYGASPLLGRRLPYVLVSSSDDGEFVARALNRLGYPTFRGSSQGTTDKRRSRLSGSIAYRQAAQAIEEGAVFVLTPDGPRGPAEVMAAGAVRLAMQTGAPVLLLGVAARPSARAKSWDRTVMPAPFGRGVAILSEPIYASGGASPEVVKALIADWSARLTAITEAAEAELA